MRWLSCLLPPVIFVLHQLSPLTFLNGINAAGFVVLSPVVLAIGFAFTAGLFGLTRVLVRKLGWKRTGFIALSLGTIGLLNVLWNDWILWICLEIASVPAALVLAPKLPSGGTSQPDAPSVA